MLMAGLSSMSASARAADPDAATAPLAGPADRDPSPWTAVGLSAGVTAFGYGALAAATMPSGDFTTSRKIVALSGLSLGLFGPATGHLWTSDFDRAALFTAGRLLLAGTTAYAVSELIAHGDSSESASYDPHPYFDETLALASLAGVAALTIWESVDAYHRAAERIEKTKGARPSFTVAPLLAPPLTGPLTPATTLAGLAGVRALLKRARSVARRARGMPVP